MSSLLEFLFIAFCLCASLGTSDAKQAERLNSLIKSRRSSRSFRGVPLLDELHTGRLYSPVYIACQRGMMEADKITALPGQPDNVDFDQYAGYVTVDPKHGRALFYYFVESPADPSSKPLVLWLNGGPGCSSLGYGAMEEIGPFRVNSDGKTLSRNLYAWNNVANILFLESPAGVGFSFSNTTSDYDRSGDKRTAQDSYTFLINWLERFPQYKKRDFFITGESYAGHYIPELADTIVQNNKITNQTIINLCGVAIGNAYLDDYANTVGGYEYVWSHALISDVTFVKILHTCNFSAPTVSGECQMVQDEAIGESGNINPYNIYAPVCGASSNSSWSGGIYMADFDPCSDDYVNSYLNNPEVQTALHVAAIPHLWSSCSGLPWNDQPATVYPIIKQVIASGVRFWLYSGDVDTICPITATRLSIRALGFPVEKSWRSWYSNNEVGGYVEAYKGLTLVTVRGAGHEVPSYQPQRALTMITSFLKDELPPPS